MTRTCNVCGIEQPISRFPKNGLDKAGNIAYRLDCKECYSITRNMKKHKVKKFVNNTFHRTGEVSTLTQKDWRKALIHFRGRCAYCRIIQGRLVKLSKDHIVPVDKNGLTVLSNLIPACKPCNSSKSNSDMETWFRAQKFFCEAQLALITQWRDVQNGESDCER